VLGLYELAIELDSRRLEADPDAARTRRRLAWCLLRVGRFAEAAEVAEPLEEAMPGNSLSLRIAETARRVRDESDPEKRAQLVARLPLLNHAEAALLTIGVAVPPARDRPR
jgi:tetratricopeptide (TPR) repeat protein